MSRNTVRLLTNAFFGDEEIAIWFPDDWEVSECRMAGHDRPPMSDDEMRQALRSPIGTPRLSDLARNAHAVCILFDDLPKPTPTSWIMPFVLDELHAGGVTDEQIRFVCAPGTHRPLVTPEFVAKLGADIVERYPVYNHSIWENLVYMGQTSRGTPVWVNREYAACDLRVAVGSIMPHGIAGFGGGGKIILPGISGMETIDHAHAHVVKSTGMGRIDDNDFRLNIEEAARLGGLHFKVDTVLNSRREVVGLFAGDFVAEHRAAIEMAAEVYATSPAENVDVVVANGYPDESQMPRTHWCVDESLREGGDMVMVSYSWEGQNLLQINSRFGTDFGGRQFKPKTRHAGLAKAGRLFILSPFLSRYDREEIAPPGRLTWCRRWEDLLAQLTAVHGAGTRVAVYPCATLQMAAKR